MLLSGVRVVELGSYVAVPGACGLLADYGADVIKVETAAGDPFRHFFAAIGRDDSENRVFETDNRGKSSIVLDIASADGAETLRALLQTADVFVTNLRPGALRRAGLDWPTLRRLNSRLIHASLTGFGATGPEADRPGFDITAFWARSGLCALATVKGGDPVQLRSGIGDHMASVALVAAVMGGLYHRERTGDGQEVCTSLLRLGVYATASEQAVQLQLGRLASTRGRHEGFNPLNNYFRTRDGRWLIVVPRPGAEDDWVRLAGALGRADLCADPRFASYADRRANAAALVAILDSAFAAMDQDSVARAFDAAGLVWGPVLSVAEAAADAQAQAAGCFVDVVDDGGQRLRTVAGPIDFECTPRTPARRAPLLNEQAAAIRAGLG